MHVYSHIIGSLLGRCSLGLSCNRSNPWTFVWEEDCVMSLENNFEEGTVIQLNPPLLSNYMYLSPRRPFMQNIKSFSIKSLYLEPLVGDHLSETTTTTFRVKGQKYKTEKFLKIDFTWIKHFKYGVRLCHYHMLTRPNFDSMCSPVHDHPGLTF